MRDLPADGWQHPCPLSGGSPGRWQQQAGFSVFFDARPGEAGELRRRTRLYHEETGEETELPGSEPAEWVTWMLGRLQSAQSPSERAGTSASVVSMEITEVR